VVLTIVAGMPKTSPEAEDQAIHLARIRDLCSALDDVREESQRLSTDITAEAHRTSDAAMAADRRHGPRVPRGRAD
jgi:hypothetical protein